MSVTSKLKIGGAAGLVLLLAFAALGPAKLQFRSGLGWQFDHVAGYFAFTVMFALAWPRPRVVGGILMAAGILLEALQALTPDRYCDLHAACYSASGALAGAIFAALCIRVMRPASGTWAGDARSVWRGIALGLTETRSAVSRLVAFASVARHYGNLSSGLISRPVSQSRQTILPCVE